MEDGYEVMKIIGPQSSKEAGSPASGGTVNLILDLSNHGDSLVQVLGQPAQAGESEDESGTEPVHRVRHSLSVLTPNVSRQRCATASHDLHPLLHTSPCPLSFTFPPTLPTFFFSLSTLCLSLLPIKTFGGGARGFWKILWVV